MEPLTFEQLSELLQEDPAKAIEYLQGLTGGDPTEAAKKLRPLFNSQKDEKSALEELLASGMVDPRVKGLREEVQEGLLSETLRKLDQENQDRIYKGISQADRARIKRDIEGLDISEEDYVKADFAGRAKMRHDAKQGPKDIEDAKKFGLIGENDDPSTWDKEGQRWLQLELAFARRWVDPDTGIARPGNPRERAQKAREAAIERQRQRVIEQALGGPSSGTVTTTGEETGRPTRHIQTAFGTASSTPAEFGPQKGGLVYDEKGVASPIWAVNDAWGAESAIAGQERNRAHQQNVVYAQALRAQKQGEMDSSGATSFLADEGQRINEGVDATIQTIKDKADLAKNYISKGMSRASSGGFSPVNLRPQRFGTIPR